MTEISFVIPGKPMGKQRARTLKTGRSYTPQETVNYETLVKQIYIMQHFARQLEGAIEGEITAYYPIPQSAGKKKREQMLSGQIRPTTKPDWDNIGKIVCDSLNGLAYRDDAQIVECVVKKYYSDMPRVEVKLREAGSNG
ncbi:RusA family crossover junction endodeoxyribonuclease [Desulfitobacterium chlororespirans]|uniref:Holliday junction resolvase RusA (Prophage-encoded endonuclease) n=1 Tax=Desulfitobacterium chlororespirans DSM 11544 TaxID=1121395 RepID=A0A1M7U3A2_9FIRM|nr:RusA family crossover junction endodeoxyribonuclease [Desulfitobacterium chlororespirans]SHN77413.1 Holliday junction resolvase RusA (prophage-encoded endonuclease) [Desulfitobacterium chlororespirans DSM 11544]